MILQNKTAPLLILFTRLPKPGLTKTRLIPALGAKGAADLQRRMTVHTLNRAQSAARRHGFALEVHYTGGERADFEQWLGADLEYRPQAPGDLGARMSQAFASAFERGFRSVVLIGTDCPQLDGNILGEAFSSLESKDLVFGPARDGGYYLIGLRRPSPELFDGVAWGTETVFEETLSKAKDAGCSYCQLEMLSDIDRPEDVAIWTAISKQTAPCSGAERISVIIPALNEAARIGVILERVMDEPGVEVIIADGGSTDDTCAIAQGFGATVTHSLPGRGRQMNAGAEVATGAILLFLHADTLLPTGFAHSIRDALKQPNNVAGAFRFRLDKRSPLFAIVEWLTNIRSSTFHEPYGDQGLFLRASSFSEIGGFRETPVLEDVIIVRALKRMGKIAVLREAAVTSARRWNRLGVLKTFLLHRGVILAYAMGASPATIAVWLNRFGYYSAHKGAPKRMRSRGNIEEQG